MTSEFVEQDLSGARFERVDLRGATFREVYLNDARLRDVDLSGLDVRGSLLKGARMRGVELIDLDIYGELLHVTVNGVDIAPLVEAELDRRMPDRAKMRPETADGFREAWTVLERLWAGTVERARTFPEADLHRGVDDEWSFIQTRRHLGFASAAWVGRMVLGDPAPWHPLDLPWDEAPVHEGVPWAKRVKPELHEVLALRRERRATVAEVLDGITDAGLGRRVTSATPFLTDATDLTVADCLRVVLNEEWEHRLYAERDLSVLQGQA